MQINYVNCLIWKSNRGCVCKKEREREGEREREILWKCMLEAYRESDS